MGKEIIEKYGKFEHSGNLSKKDIEKFKAILEKAAMQSIKKYSRLSGWNVS